MVHTRGTGFSVAARALHSFAGLTMAAIFAVRTLGRFSQQFPLAATMVAATATIYFGVHAVTVRLAGVELRRLIEVAALFISVLIVIPGQSWLRAGIDRMVSRRSRRRWAELQVFVHSLAPEF